MHGGYFMSGGVVSQFRVRAVRVQFQMNPKQDLSGFEVTVGVTRSLMMMNGVWPDPNNEEHWLIPYYFLLPTFIISFFSFVPQTILALMIRNDFNKLLEVLSTGQILIGVAILKLIGFRYNKNDLRKLVLSILEDWNQPNRPAEEQRIMWHNAHLSRLVVVVCSTTFSSTIFLQAARVMIVYYVEKHRLEANISLEKPHYLEAHFLFFDADSSPMHEIIFIGQMVAAVFTVACFSSFDGFFVFAILHLSGQLRHLQMRLENIVEEGNKRNCTIEELLKPIIERHQQINSLADLIEENFNKLFLAQIIATSILLCLQGYQFVMFVGESSGSELYGHILFFTMFTISNTTSVFLYCYITEQLRTESEGLFYAAYNSNWYSLTPSDSKLLLPFMARTMKPMAITVGKFGIFSLQYFTTILKTSGGYLSMLLAVKDRF